MLAGALTRRRGVPSHANFLQTSRDKLRLQPVRVRRRGPVEVSGLGVIDGRDLSDLDGVDFGERGIGLLALSGAFVDFFLDLRHVSVSAPVCTRKRQTRGWKTGGGV